MKAPVVPLAVAISLLEGTEFVKRNTESAERGLVDLVFRGRERQVRMLWSLTDEVEMPLPSGQAPRILSMWGRPIQPAGTAARAVPVTPEPIYVVRGER